MSKYNKEYRHNYYVKHKEKCAEQQREYIRNNREKRYKITSSYNKKNRDKFKVWKAKYREKVKDNPSFKLSTAMRGGIHHALKVRNDKKNGRHWEDLVGYTVNELIDHIGKLLKDKMTWENYGSYWHIDHIIPQSWFKYVGTDDPQFKACWTLENLQPLPAIENARKHNYWAGKQKGQAFRPAPLRVLERAVSRPKLALPLPGLAFQLPHPKPEAL